MVLDDGFRPTAEDLSSHLRPLIERLTRMLSNACLMLEERGGLNSLDNEELHKWWENRQQIMRQEQFRRRKEKLAHERALAEQAKTKLTPKELDALKQAFKKEAKNG